MTEGFEYSDILDHRYECFTEDRTDEYTVGIHWHYFMEIVYMMKGEIELQIDNKKHTVRPGEMVVLLPSVMHSIRTLSPHTLYSVIKFTPGNLKEIHDSGSMAWSELALLKIAVSAKTVRSHFPAPMVRHMDIKHLMTFAVTEMNEKSPGYVSNIRAAVQIILTNIIRVWQREGLSAEEIDPASPGNITIEALPAYIEENISRTLVVDELAEMCSLSYSGFSKKFHRMFGRSCKKYIEQVRLKKAAQLLRNTDMDLNALSQETGFSDASHMIRCFRKEFGVTPKKYRDQI